MLREFGLMLGSLPPAARKALAATLVLLDQGARLYPPSRGRRFARLDDRVAGAYIRALLARHDVAAEMIRRLKSVVTMCYYELPEVQREIGYEPPLTSRPSPGAAWSPTARRSARPKQTRGPARGTWDLGDFGAGQP